MVIHGNTRILTFSRFVPNSKQTRQKVFSMYNSSCQLSIPFSQLVAYVNTEEHHAYSLFRAKGSIFPTPSIYILHNSSHLIPQSNPSPTLCVLGCIQAIAISTSIKGDIIKGNFQNRKMYDPSLTQPSNAPVARRVRWKYQYRDLKAPVNAGQIDRSSQSQKARAV